MARRLPWDTGADAVEAFKGNRTPVQRGRQENPVSSDKDLASKPKAHQMSSPMKLPSNTRVRKRETSRTPSTSPPPAPPPAQLMHEGYHADDIFIMVEDEFQAVAQSFTRHLHHAEYVRMKKKVRTAPLPTVSQPLQGMRAEIYKKLEMKGLQDRQNIAVKSMIDGAGRASPDNEKEAQLNDPWQGTSLAGLMTKDSTQSRMALVGLEKIPSTTRAAKGFKRGGGDNLTKWQENRSALEIYGGKNKGERTTSLIIDSPTEEADEDDDDDSDDLGGPPMTNAVSKSGTGKLCFLETEKALDKKFHVDPAQPSNTINVFPSPHHSRPQNGTKAKFSSDSLQPSSKLSSHSLRRKIDSFDDFNDEDSDQFSTRSRSDFSSSSKTRPKGKGAKEKENRSRLNEIPTFLV